MTKQEAIDLFGGIKSTAYALDITTPAVSMWPNKLNRRTVERVVFVLIKQGRINEAKQIASQY